MSSISDNPLNDHKSKQVRSVAPRRRLPLASLLVERGIFAHVDEARRWIMAGKVLVNDQLMDKPGMVVPRDAHLRVRGRARYASRAGYKLEAALDAFAVEVAGQVALDCGASTGGFTDCLLQRGAEMVYSVDVGYGQLLGRLRVDPRVRNLERTNLSDLTADTLQHAPTLITLDLSYLSLTKALPVAATLLAPEGEILALVKPLFEVESQDARRSGRIDDVALLVEALRQVAEAGLNCGLSLQGIVKLALRPRYGVHEFFTSFIRRPDAPDRQYDEHTLLDLIQGQGVGVTQGE
ncbi:TlyA family rRNA (cytidine-2'-O)-methyltransferase [Dictyobacter sp. S3.2.2.5]|uniref:TlyA family rRNA (Cytidine-2'-O)-methyltransferase n=1 Tax=Dictyobacter halimunensis TaxID=3026934 RepID=A0ABQ6G3E2_9CHLR|nr:TlyA family rRNA (cytidine-2'-O)-methyltransferase [Dictyobacter sp. S3.2.2.5]